MKKIIFTILTFCIVFAAAQAVLAARGNCTVSLNNPMYNMVGGKTNEPTPTLTFTSDNASVSPIAVHLVLDGADWDFNKMSSIDKNIAVSASSEKDIQVKITKEYLKRITEEESKEITIPLYAKNFEDGLIRLKVNQTPNYMKEYDFLFACNMSGTLYSSYSSKGVSIYSKGISVLSDITLTDTSTFEVVPNETYFIINVNDYNFTIDTLPEAEGTGKFEGIVSVEKAGSAKLKITTTQTSPEGKGTIVLKNLQLNKISNYKTDAPEITISACRRILFNTDDGEVKTKSYDYTNKFISGTVVTEASPFSAAATQEKQSVVQSAYNVLTFTAGQTGYTLNDSYVPTESPCITANSHTLLPLRIFTQILGIKNENVYYDAETKTVTIIQKGNTLIIEQDGDYMTVNGEKRLVSAPASNYGGSLYLPVRDVCVGLGIDEKNISFNNESKTVTIIF